MSHMQFIILKSVLTTSIDFYFCLLISTQIILMVMVWMDLVTKINVSLKLVVKNHDCVLLMAK